MSYILVKDTQTGVWQRVPEKELRNEEELQELVKMNPDSLPIDDLGGNCATAIGCRSGVQSTQWSP